MTDLLNILSQKRNQHPDNGEEVVVIVLNIKQTSNKVWQNGLQTKLKTKWLNSYNSYPSERSICVTLSGKSSNTALFNTSVPQIFTLGPLLFSVFIDDLVKPAIPMC